MASRRVLSSLFLAASWVGVQAQTTANYTDAATGIKFLQITQENGHAFGVALPETATGSDFIGQISAPLSEGWAGVSLTSSMTAGLLVVAWPNGNDVVAALRKAVS
jgi:cellobiose dehydrogenase (acceptor)